MQARVDRVDDMRASMHAEPDSLRGYLKSLRAASLPDAVKGGQDLASAIRKKREAKGGGEK